MLRIERVSKSFGPVRALDSVTLEFYSGEIHGVLGENGAGKSTLMAILAGFVVPDSGRIVLEASHEVRFGKPHEARSLGIRMVHQHFMLVPNFSVAENFALGTLQLAKGRFDSGEAARRVAETARELGWDIDPEARVETLPVGAQQRLEIVKALAGKARVLILDEPTAVLSPDEVEDLFRVLRRLKGEGVCVVLIAHKLSEVMSVCDRVSVLRRGAHVATAAIAQVDESQLTTWMVGELPPSRSPLRESRGGPLVNVTGLHVEQDRGYESVRGLSFEIAQGEILGIGGVDGNGQLELAEAVAGLRRPTAGEINWTIHRPKIGYVPQDRQDKGLALGMSVLENYLIGSAGGPFINLSAHRERTRMLVEQFDVRIGSLDDPVRSLSGGNQQKLVVSRVLATSPDLVVAHNPTRGLDVRATAFVQSKIIEAARNGAGVLLVSTDLDELSVLASRILFMNRGTLAAGGAEAMVG